MMTPMTDPNEFDKGTDMAYICARSQQKQREAGYQTQHQARSQL